MGQIVSRKSNSEYFIYTKSGCEYCKKVKELLQENSKSYEEINCDSQLKTNKEEFLRIVKQETGQDWRTFPIVFRKNKFIGGYSETVNYIEMENSFTSFYY